MATPIDFACPRCRALEGEPCWTLTDGAMRSTPHDARRRRAGQRIERPEATRKQIDARDAGARHFTIAGALANLRNVARCRSVAAFSAEDEGDVDAAIEALERIEARRQQRKDRKAGVPAAAPKVRLTIGGLPIQEALDRFRSG
jgi:hypothetical protein